MVLFTRCADRLLIGDGFRLIYRWAKHAGVRWIVAPQRGVDACIMYILNEVYLILDYVPCASPTQTHGYSNYPSKLLSRESKLTDDAD